jgi:hypothetical protein
VIDVDAVINQKGNVTPSKVSSLRWIDTTGASSLAATRSSIE